MTPSDELVQVLCGRGWDAPVEPDLERAAILLADNEGLATSDLYTACVCGAAEAVRARLADDPDLVHRPGGPRDWPPLLYTAFSFAHRLPGRDKAVVDTLRVLLDGGADPNTAYDNPEHMNTFSALYGTIAVSGHRARTAALLGAGASPSDGNSTFCAVETFDFDLLVALGEAGIDHDDVSYVIKHAIDMRWEQAVRYLLDLGADPDAPHPGAGETTLHWAIKRGASATVIGWLLEAGADPDRTTLSGRAAFLPILGNTPYDFALRLGHVEAAGLLEQAGVSRTGRTELEELVFAVARGDRERAQALSHLVTELPPEDLGLVAHWAQHGRTSAVALGLELGFDPTSTARMGLTAVHWAALRGEPGMLRVALDGGCPVVDLGGYFGSPADTAARCQWYESGDYPAVLDLLLGRLTSSA